MNGFGFGLAVTKTLTGSFPLSLGRDADSPVGLKRGRLKTGFTQLVEWEPDAGPHIFASGMGLSQRLVE